MIKQSNSSRPVNTSNSVDLKPKPLKIRSLLSALNIDLSVSSKYKKHPKHPIFSHLFGIDVTDQFFASGRLNSWAAFVLYSLGVWLAALVLGDGVLAFVSANFPSEEESRYTVIFSSFIGALGLLIAYLIFINLKNIIARMLSISLALGSEYLIVMTIAGEGYSFFWATIAALLLLILMTRLFTCSTHQIGLSAIFCTMLIFTLSLYSTEYSSALIIFCTLPVSLFGLFYPMKGLDLRPMGMVFLLCPLILSLYDSVLLGIKDNMLTADVIARIVYMGFYAFILYVLFPALKTKARKFLLITFVPILLISVLTSSGIAASFLVLFIAYALQSRLVMSAGIVINIIFTGVFYYYLDLPLNEKGGLMLAFGLLVLCVLYWLKISTSGTTQQTINK